MTLNDIFHWLGNTNIVALIIWLIVGYIALQVVGFVLWLACEFIASFFEKVENKHKKP